MTSSPFKGSVTKTFRTGFASEAETVASATTYATATSKPGGLSELMKIPDLTLYYKTRAKGSGGGGTGGLT